MFRFVVSASFAVSASADQCSAFQQTNDQQPTGEYDARRHVGSADECCGNIAGGGYQGASYHDGFCYLFTTVAGLEAKQGAQTFVSGAPSPSPPGTIQHIELRADTSKCIGLDGAVTGGTLLQLKSCTADDGEKFVFDAEKALIQHGTNTGMCIDIQGGDAKAGTSLQLWECNGIADNQAWGYDEQAGRIFHCMDDSCDKAFCFDLPGGDMSEGNHIWLWDCYETAGQQWKFVDAANPPTPSPTPSPSPPPSPPPSPSPAGETTLTKSLNEQIRFGGDNSHMYTGGKGILVRSPFDGLEDDASKTVVPATFWVNDIFAPSQLYPGSGAGDGNPWCPNNGDSGWGPVGYTCRQDSSTGESGPWNYAQMGVVVASKMGQLFHDYENIQADDWGWGVFYASDANTVDKRCRYLDQYEAYDCPGYWQNWQEDPSPDSSKKGAGGYGWGNPTIDPSDMSSGGGAGCHFEPATPAIDQTNGWDSAGNNLVQDRYCQCNYAFRDDWSKWVENWMYNGELLGGGTGPSWAVDLGMCWVNNPRDMINIQNNLWWYRTSWNNGLIPTANYNSGNPSDERPYWGWNEIPVDRLTIAKKENWDAILIKLPAAMSGNGDNDSLDTLSNGAKDQLVKDIDSWVSSRYLDLGENGKPVVVVREKRDSSGNYFREFFCQTWSHGKYSLVMAQDKCYMKANSVEINV